MSKPSKFKVAKCDLEETRTGIEESLENRIFVVRGQRVMLDRDLAQLYGVTTKRVNEQLRRNRKRFPKDFAFQLSLVEAKALASSRSQIATLKKGQNIKHPPHAFTEHGAIMLASVLNSVIAVEASVYVVRAFVKMRTTLLEYAYLSRRIDALEDEYGSHFRRVFTAIRHLIAAPAKPQRPIGFIQLNASRKKRGNQ